MLSACVGRERKTEKSSESGTNKKNWRGGTRQEQNRKISVKRPRPRQEKSEPRPPHPAPSPPMLSGQLLRYGASDSILSGVCPNLTARFPLHWEL